VDSRLSEALAPVLDDLRNSGGPVPDVRDAQWPDFPGQVAAMLYAADGSGQGVSAMVAEVRDGRAVWTCPRSGHASDRVGSLRAPAR
jgi:hypothetical protein